MGAAVHVMSSGHASGGALAQICGVAAVLRYPIYDIEEAAGAYPRRPGHAVTGSSSNGGGGNGRGGVGALSAPASSSATSHDSSGSGALKGGQQSSDLGEGGPHSSSTAAAGGASRPSQFALFGSMDDGESDDSSDSDASYKRERPR